MVKNSTPPIMNHLFEIVRQEDEKEERYAEYLKSKGYIVYKSK